MVFQKSTKPLVTRFLKWVVPILYGKTFKIGGHDEAQRKIRLRHLKRKDVIGVWRKWLKALVRKGNRVRTDLPRIWLVDRTLHGEVAPLTAICRRKADY